ncbi:hypothetical protein PV682_23495 [Streptomyces niveiscabiei]|uniref:hypothetical protein n=1 Tax=Streptomyces niveiscabiei TaxID=164115 RepID=UPI0029B8D979|nr:hypothetical protein [Streptomyces niveiscabiei]MDX3384406.1 hypothetical protein [Streptomyces niveiscabiei]
MKRLRRSCLALALGLALPLGTAGVSAAAPGTALACPAEGTRFTTPTTGDTVFLVGPSEFLYYIPSRADYFRLWRTWDGIATVDRAACAKTAYALSNARLRQVSGFTNVFIWDESWDDFGQPNRYRWITSWSVFAGKYHFDPEKIVVVGALGPIMEPNWT